MLLHATLKGSLEQIDTLPGMLPAAAPEGWRVLQMCPSTKVEVYDINRPLDIPWNDFDRAKAILENHRVSEGNRFEWKMNAMVTGEKAGWDLWGRSSYLYFLVRLLPDLGTPAFKSQGCVKVMQLHEERSWPGICGCRSLQYLERLLCDYPAFRPPIQGLVKHVRGMPIGERVDGHLWKPSAYR